jgi:hypothetical protein
MDTTLAEYLAPAAGAPHGSLVLIFNCNSGVRKVVTDFIGRAFDRVFMRTSDVVSRVCRASKRLSVLKMDGTANGTAAGHDRLGRFTAGHSDMRPGVVGSLRRSKSWPPTLTPARQRSGWLLHVAAVNLERRLLQRLELSSRSNAIAKRVQGIASNLLANVTPVSQRRKWCRARVNDSVCRAGYASISIDLFDEDLFSPVRTQSAESVGPTAIPASRPLRARRVALRHLIATSWSRR